MARFEFEGWHNRWLVSFSSAALALLAVISGMSRQFLERVQSESRIDIMPREPISYAGLSVIALLFMAGMTGNLGLLLRPVNRRSGLVSLLVTGAVVGILLILAGTYGMRAIYCLNPGSVSGSE